MYYRKNKIIEYITIKILLIVLLFISFISYNYDIKNGIYLWVILFIILLIFVFVGIYKFLNNYNNNIIIYLFLLFVLILIVADQSISVLISGRVSFIYKYGYPSNKIIILSIIHLILFLNVLLTIFCIVINKKIYIKSKFKISPCSDNNIIMLIIFFVVGLIPYLSYGLSNITDIIFNSRAAWGGTSQFGLYGTGTTFLIFLHNFTISSALISGYYLSFKRIGKIKFILCLGIFVLSTIVVASSGTRTKIGLVLFPLIMSSIYVSRQKNRFLSLFKYMIVFIGVLLLLSIMVQYRSVGFGNIVDDSKNNNLTSPGKLDMTGADLGSELFVILRFYEKPLACDGYLECALYPIWDTLNKFITNPIPRRIWPEKYLDPSFAHYNRFRTGYSGLTKKSGTNITPTVIGRYYMLYGSSGIIFPAVIFGLILGVLQNQLIYIKNITKIDLVIVFSFLFYMVQSIREFAPGYLYGYIFMLLYFTINNRKVNHTKQYYVNITH